MEPIRNINKIEKAIIEHLAKKAKLQLPNDWETSLLIQQMDDGGMGSFLIFEDASDIGIKRKFGKQVSEFDFTDEDKVRVIVSLNVDEQNRLFEVDVWKTDFSPVINFKIPN